MTQIPLSIYLLFPSSIFILLVSVYLAIKKKKTATTIFLIVGVLQFLWMASTLTFWRAYFFNANEPSPFAVKLLSLSVFLIPTFLYHFSIEFCRIQKQKILLFLSYISSIGLIAASDASLAMSELFSLKLLGFSTENFIYYFFAVFVLILLFLTMYNFVKAWLRKEGNKERRETMMFILLSFGTFGLTLIYFVPVSFINIFPIFFLIIPIYTFILGYVIIEKDPFATILTTDIIVAVLLVLLASFIVFPGLELGMIAKSIIFILISFICFLLLRYMNRINNRNLEFEEIVEKRTKELQEKTWRLNEANDKLEETNTVLEINVRARTRELKELNDNLEMEIQKRTKELRKKTAELEERVEELKQFSSIFIDRENKMAELKNKINDLEYSSDQTILDTEHKNKKL